MKLIPLTQDKWAQVDDKWYGYLMQWKWYAKKDGNNFYAKRGRKVNGKVIGISMHRIILGVNNSKILVDHRDGNGLNNQEGNLRIASNQQNRHNSKPNKNTTSQYKGVSWNIGVKKWLVRICAQGKGVHIGVFDFEIDAALAYNEAAIKYHGEYAFLNKISTKNSTP